MPYNDHSASSCTLRYVALDRWKSNGLVNLSETTLYQDIKRLADRCRVVFGCLDMEYDVDDIVLDYVVYRLVCFLAAVSG